MTIASPDGYGVLTSVRIDGEEVKGVTRILYEAGPNEYATVTLSLIADLRIEGQAAVVRDWRRALRWGDRIRLWLRPAGL